MMKIDSPEFQAIFTPELETLSNIFKKYNHELRIAGGAVRDVLLSKTPHDLDFATTATPVVMKDMFNQEDIRIINSNGESHGTITARINENNFEVTTLRIDVVTDGRHASVEFTDKWELDAERRDLTVNSMFLGLDGTLYDYFNGHNDLQAGKIAFVGNAEKRIQEDYLRILRYFRFYGRIAHNPNSHDPKTLEVIKNNLDGLKNISGERIWSEFHKILIGNDADKLIDVMFNLGMTSCIGMPKEVNIEQFKLVYKNARHLDPQPVTLVSALLKSPEEFLVLQKRMKFSNFDRDLGLFILKNRNNRNSESGDVHFYQSLIFETAGNVNNVKKLACELLKYHCKESVLKEIDDWEIPKFPVSGNKIMEAGIKRGPSFKLILDGLKSKWIHSKFLLDEKQLMEYLPEVLNLLKYTKNDSK